MSTPPRHHWTTASPGQRRTTALGWILRRVLRPEGRWAEVRGGDAYALVDLFPDEPPTGRG